MASLTLKNLPDGLLRALRKVSARDRRSLNQEIIHLLEASVLGKAGPQSRHDARAQVVRWRKLAGKWRSDVDEATEVRRIARRRTRGREVDL